MSQIEFGQSKVIKVDRAVRRLKLERSINQMKDMRTDETEKRQLGFYIDEVRSS